MKLRAFGSRPTSSSNGDGTKKKKKKMKFGKTPTHLREAGRERDEKRPKKVASDEGADWATTDVEEINSQVETNRHMSSQNRPPEFFMKDGEKKRIRFRSDAPIAGFYEYTVKMGNDFKNFTKPREGTVDLFAKKGLRPGLKILWEIIDVDGYTNRAGERLRFVPKYWRMGARLNEQVQAILEQYGSIKNRVIVVTRRGKQTNTTYTLLPEGRTKPHPKELAAEKLKPKWREFYKPPTPEVQKSIIGNVTDPNDDKD